ncbi:MAG: ATPase, T2SS/T4P/T4SS family [bacterium]
MIKTEDLIKEVEEKKLITSSQLDQAVAEAKKNKIDLAEFLKTIIDPEEIAKIEANYCGLPYENLQEGKIPEEILHIISADVAQNYRIICFEKVDNEIKVGITDPDNFKAIEAVDFLAKEENLSVKYYFISKASFKAAFQKYKSLKKEISTAVETKVQETQDKKSKTEDEEVSLEEVTKSAPVAKIVAVVIRHAVEGGASDIHIEPLKNESRIRYRIDGILHTSLVLPKSVHKAIIARVKVMANMKLDETRVPQDGRFKIIVNEKGIDFRISTLPLGGEEKVVMRILDTSKGAPKMEELGIEGIQSEIIKNNIRKTEGLMLVTGPTGSGKSTTIFSFLDILNKEGVNIATLEDPVEYQIEGVNQSQIKPEIGYTFASGLRSLLRQDPNVILVGEIRDNETAELAIHAALTGHYVLSTLHTNSAISAIARLIDMNIEPFLIGSTLHTVIAQRLVRKICENCKQKIKVPKEYADDARNEIKKIGIDYAKKMLKDLDVNNLVFYEGKGCARCGNSGYSGRLAILEVLDVNKKLQDIIKEGKKFLSEEHIKNNQHFITARQDGMMKILEGKTTISEVLRVMKD